MNFSRVTSLLGMHMPRRCSRGGHMLTNHVKTMQSCSCSSRMTLALHRPGTMAVYVDGKKIARLDQHIHEEIVRLVSHEKPVLVCLNQMSRYKDFGGTPEKTKKQLQAVKDLVIKDADGACGPLDVRATEFMKHDEHLKESNVKGLEYVSCQLTSDMSAEVNYCHSFCGLCILSCCRCAQLQTLW